jgi:transcriptional regulator with XRE-family HTH domain
MARPRTLDRIEPSLWFRSDMRTALARRNISTVFRLLQRAGVSQRRIAALTGQSQSEISEILGGRQVLSYDVLVRIADGLGVPRGQLGLAYDDLTAELVGGDRGAAGPELSRLAELAHGSTTIDPSALAQPFLLGWERAPQHVGPADVDRLVVVTAQLRAVDYAHGGGASRDPAVAQVGWAQQLLRADASGEVPRALHVAVGDLHLLAGWSSFDVGLIGPARRHFTRALEHARFAEEPSLVAKALYCLARVHIHHGWGAQAVRVLELGLTVAEESGLVRAVAMVRANLAWAHALVGQARPMETEIARALDSFGVAEEEPAPAWLSFFDAAEVEALRGAALAYLPGHTSQQRSVAIERFEISTALRELPMTRSRAFELTMLSWMLLEEGDREAAARIGHEAVDLAETLRSQRVIDRFAPLRTCLAARGRVGDPKLRDLEARIAALGRPASSRTAQAQPGAA